MSTRITNFFVYTQLLLLLYYNNDATSQLHNKHIS